MKNKIRFVFVLLLLITPFCKSEAQFWKGREQKEQKPKPRPIQKAGEKTESQSKNKRIKIIEYPVSRIKARYRVDILLPLYLDELILEDRPAFKDRLPEKALIGMGFYEGIKLAADTLSALGYNLDIYVHDITSKGKTPKELVTSNSLAGTDLIIGALQSNQIAPIAAYAKEANVNFISALSPSDADVRDNPFFTLLQPRLEKHCDKIREVILKKYTSWNITLLYRDNNNVDSLAYSYFTDGAGGSLKKTLCNEMPEKSKLESLFDSGRVNVIAMPIVENNYVDSILQQLTKWFPGYEFEIYGMPSWKFINNLKKTDAYPEMSIIFTSPFYYDYTTPLAQELLNNHKKQFGTRPAETVFRGYEVLYWYAYLLQSYGTVFNTKYPDNSTASFTRFDIKPQWADGTLLYNENEHIYLYQYRAGSYNVTQ